MSQNVLDPRRGTLRDVRVQLALLGVVIVTSGLGLVVPGLPLLARSMDSSVASVGLALSAFSAARLVIELPAAFLADRFGTRAGCAIGAAALGFGMFASGHATSVVQLMVWRFVAGAGSGTFTFCALVYLTGRATVQTRRRVVSAYTTSLATGNAIGPIFGGWIAASYGLRAPFFVMAVLGAVMAVGQFFALEKAPHVRPTTEAAEPTDFRKFISSPLILTILGSSAFTFFTRTGLIWTLVPLLTASKFEYNAAQIGKLISAFASATVAMNVVLVLLADRINRIYGLVAGFVFMSIAMFFLGLTTSTWTFVGMLIMYGLGSSLLANGTAVLIAEISTSAHRARALAALRMITEGGAALGPTAIGTIGQLTSLSAAFVVCGVLGVVLGAIAAWFLIQAERERPSG